MDLPNLFSKNRSQSKNLFMSLVLTDRSTQSGLWHVADQKIILSNQSGVHYFDNHDERLIQIDASLLELGKQSEDTDEILFGLEPNWVNEEDILPERKKELKEITEELSLNPVGFVLVTEVLHQYLVQKNPHLSTVVLYVGAGFIELMLIRQGKLIRTLSVGKSDNIVLDLKEALARLEQQSSSEGKHLPPNLMLASASVDQEKIEQHQQQLMEQDWQQEMQFIQAPVIDSLGQDKLLQVITQQGGRAVAQDQGLLPPDDVDLSQQNQAQPSQTEEATSFGIPVGDNFQEAQGSEKAVNEPAETAVSDQSEQSVQPDQAQSDSVWNRFKLNPFKQKQRAVPSNQTRPTQPQKRSPGPKKNKIKLIAIAGVLAGLVASAGIYFYYLSRNYQAKVSIQPTIMNLNKETDIILDPEAESTDAENRILKAQVIEKEVSGSDTVDTTGVKLVGEKAAGTVALFNKTDSEKTFESGTELSSGDIKFVLDSEVTLPPATTEENPTGDGATQEYGQTEVEVTAAEIGAEGNLTEDTNLQIADFSENTYQAKVLEDLTGGSSREIRVVAEEDQQELLVSLRQQLLKQARDEFESESGNGEYIKPTNVYAVISQNYSAEIGDEVEQLSLDLTLSVQGITYTAEDLRLLAKDVLASEIPPNYKLVDEFQDFLTQPAEEAGEDDVITITTQLTGTAKAEVSEDQIKQEIANLNLQEAESKLNSQETIEAADISLIPQFSQWIFKSLPANQQRILVQVE